MDELLTLAEAAAFLRLSRRTLWNQRYRREAPGSLGFRIGGVVRFRRSDLNKYVERQAEVR